MSELTLGRIDPLPAVRTSPAGQQSRGSGHQPAPRRRRKHTSADLRLIASALPENDPDDLALFFETANGDFTGITIKHALTGETVLHLSADQVRQQAPYPGLIFERGA